MGFTRNLFVLVCLTLMVSGLSAQSILKQADKQFELHAYNTAARSYQRVLEKQPNNVDALTNLAMSYYRLNRMDEAEIYFKRAIGTNSAEPMTYLYYGHTLKAVGKYEEAKKQYYSYASYNSQLGFHYAESCDFATTHLNDAPQYDVANEFINSPAADFGPTIYGDRVAFSSARIDVQRLVRAPKTSSLEGRASNQLFIAGRDENQFLVSPEFLRSDLREKYNEGPIAYSPDGRMVAITKNSFADGTRQIPETGMELSLYIAEVDENGDWENPIPFPFNGPGFSNGFPSFSPDGTALYFASDRAGGYGGFDIYISYRAGSSWTKPENLGSVINTEGDEITPFFDGKKLHFASDYHKGFGGFDLFEIQQLRGVWSDVMHMGTGVNSPRDDYGYTFDSYNNIGYFVSNRVGGKGQEDIYRLIPRGETITIQVINAIDRTPVAGAEINLTACDMGIYQTDLNGAYQFQPDGNLSCTGVVKKDGFGVQTFSITSNVIQQSRKIEVFLTEESSNQYQGQVVDVTTGKPLEEVSIRAINQSNGQTMQAVTDFRGVYTLPLLSNSSYVLSFSKEGYVEISKVIRTRDDDDRTALLGTISLTPAGTVTEYSNPLNDIMPPGISTRSRDVPASYGAEDARIETKSTVTAYAIQVAAFSRDYDLDLNPYDQKLGALQTVYVHDEDNKKKVRVGPFETRDDANAVLDKVKAKGYKSAFVVKQEVPAEQMPGGASMTPKGANVPDSYSNFSGMVFTNNGKKTAADQVQVKAKYGPEAQRKAASSSYLVKIASYKDTKWFDPEKVNDVGVLEKRKKDDFTIMLLRGFNDYKEAQEALKTIRSRGFTGAYLVEETSEGGLKRVN